ncbi:MAG: TRAP transporter substrate-binding protein [Deltaproteobacteria bacterium]|nr:TRAP transporter substrate-binding protein [Deltaproteobacteria bacterium]
MRRSLKMMTTMLFAVISFILFQSALFADDQVTFHIGATVSPKHSWYKAAELFGAEVEKASGGTIKVQIEMGGVHGGERQMVTEAMRGVLDMVWTSDIGVAAVIPSVGFVNLPYLFKDYKDVDARYINGWMGKQIEADCLKKGLMVLTHGENDFRAVTNSKRPIKSGEDFKGLKLRVPEVPIYIAFYKGLGALPTPMAITEVPTALQQKTVDGQDNGAIITYDFGFHQFQKYMTRANQIYSGSQLLISKKKFDSLSDKQKQIVLTAAKNAGVAQVKMNREMVEGYYKEMAATGVEVIEVTDVLSKDMAVVAEKVWKDPETVKAFGQATIDKIVAEKK